MDIDMVPGNPAFGSDVAVYMRPGHREFAIAQERKLTEKDPEFPDGWTKDPVDMLAGLAVKRARRGRVAYAEGRYEEARALFVDAGNFIMMAWNNAGRMVAEGDAG